MTSAPATLPTAARAWCLRDPLKPRAAPAIVKPMPRREPVRRPARFIALNTECVTSETASLPGFDGDRWAWEGQALLFGCAVIGPTHDWRIEREVIFYRDDLPEGGLAMLRQYVEERTYRHGARPRKQGDPEPHLKWRDERHVVVQLLPLSQFLKLFYRIAYEDRALVIGFNLAFDLTRLAADWHEVKKGNSVGGWHLDLWTFTDPTTGKKRPSAGWRPAIILKRIAPNVTFIEFTGRRGGKDGTQGSRYRGEFLDVLNLAHGLTGRHWTLAELWAAFTGEVRDKRIQPGRIAADNIDHRRAELREKVSLAETLLELFDRLHPVSRGARGRLSETRLYSPGGLARAYLTAGGFSPPAVPKDRLGPCAAAFFGGWAEVQVRGRVPVVHVDFRRQYQTVFLLQRMQELLAAEHLTFIEDTEAIRAFAERVTLDDLLRPETWLKLNALCWIKPAGEIIVGRWAFDDRPNTASLGRFSLAMAPRYSDEPVVVNLAEVITAKLLSGRPPEIVRAERIVPEGRQHLAKTRLFGGTTFDPKKDQLFKVLVEEGERFSRGIGPYAQIPVPVREVILPSLKAIGNVGCFGALIETREADLLPGRREEVTLLSDGEPLRAAVAHPEDPGPVACPPLSGLVTAGGRLLLAMVHQLVTERGGIVAACDTDGAHIVATAEGGTVCIESRGEKFYEGGPAEPVHALSWVDVEKISARFEGLNPFDRKLLPGSPLRVQRINFDGSDSQIALEGLFISAKRYSLSRPDGSFADRKESILGMLSPPSPGWINEAWRTLSEMSEAGPLSPRPWFHLPAVRSLAVTSPAFARQMRGTTTVQPWNSFLAATAIGRKSGEQAPRRAVAVAPFERDPEKWAALPWRFADSGELVPFDRRDNEGVRWRLRMLRDFLTSYAQHPASEMLAPDGSRCGPFTRGVLRRRPMRDGERWLVLKEAAVYGDDPRHAFTVPEPETVRRPEATDQSGAFVVWESMIKPALAIVGSETVAGRMGLTARSGRAWATGERRPEEPGKVARAIVAIAQEAGLNFPDDQHLRADEICGQLPGRAALVQCFVSIAVALFTDRLGDIRAFARAMAEIDASAGEAKLRRWLALMAGEVRPIGYLNRIVAQLGKFSRAQMRNARRRIRTERGPIGDRQAILAWLSVLYGTEKPEPPQPEEADRHRFCGYCGILINFLPKNTKLRSLREFD